MYLVLLAVVITVTLYIFCLYDVESIDAMRGWGKEYVPPQATRPPQRMRTQSSVYYSMLLSTNIQNSYDYIGGNCGFVLAVA